MKFDKPELFLGKQADSDVIMTLMRELDLGNRVSIKRDEMDAHLNNFKKGISLLFESERYAHARHGIELPTDAPVLISIFLYGAENDEFSPFAGELINGLTFSDGRTDALNKLGPSKGYDEYFNSETWDFPEGFLLYVDYSEDKSKISLVQYQVIFK